MDSIAILILAAGLGKRLGGNKPKVLAELSGRPLLSYVLESSFALNPERVVVITGHGRTEVEDAAKNSAASLGQDVSKLRFAVQEKQQGTGDAVKSAMPALADFSGIVIVLYGDMPLLLPQTLERLLRFHHEGKSTLSVVTASLETPPPYGRIIRDDQNRVKAVREAKDCSPDELMIKELNCGIYAVDSAFLGPAVQGLTNDNAQGEYYLTDIVEKAAGEGQNIVAIPVSEIAEVKGVNTPADLAEVRDEVRKRNIQKLINEGVNIVDRSTFFFDPECEIEAGVSIGPNTQLFGKTILKTGVVIEGSAYLQDVHVGENSRLRFGVRAEDVKIGAHCAIGPFAHLRPGTILEEDVKIGNFVETKKAHLKKGAKASHLSYLGDAEVGEEANIGAGTITCNYDGYKKSKTEIGARAFIGSNSSLVAPVKIGEGAVVGAGSTISRTVASDALALTRAEQKSYPGWAKKKRESAKK